MKNKKPWLSKRYFDIGSFVYFVEFNKSEWRINKGEVVEQVFFDIKYPFKSGFYLNNVQRYKLKYRGYFVDRLFHLPLVVNIGGDTFQAPVEVIRKEKEIIVNLPSYSLFASHDEAMLFVQDQLKEIYENHTIANIVKKKIKIKKTNKSEKEGVCRG